MSLALKIKEGLNKAGRFISDDKLIVFDYKALLFLFFVLIFFSITVIFKIHGSSIYIWRDYVIDNQSADKVIFSSPKWIRSDEYFIQTPFILSQAAKGFPTKNPAIGPGNTALITAFNLPVWHYTTLFKPQHWGFFVLDLERAFSFFWNYKIFVLLIAIFLLVMLLTGNNFFLSVIASLWFYFSSFTQWWFSLVISETVIDSCLIIICIIYILFSRRRLFVFLCPLLLIGSSLNFIFHFYPPYQVLLFYLIIAVLISYIINIVAQKQQEMIQRFSKNWPQRIVFLVVSFLAVIMLSLFFYFQNKEIFALIAQTVYPGQRISSGGGLGFFQYFSGLFGLSPVGSRSVFNFNNICEASSFVFLFFIPLFFITRSIIKKEKIDYQVLFLLIYIIAISLWALIPFPSFIGKITLLNRVPFDRVMLGLGLANILAVILFFNQKSRLIKSSIKPKYFFLFWLFIVWIMAGLGLGLHFLKPIQILVASTLLFLISLAILLKNKWFLFISLIIPLVFLNIGVNPVSIGLDPLETKNVEILKTVKEISDKDPGARWAVYGFWLANFLKVTGADVLNGVQYLPNGFASSLDANGEFNDVYNRYADIELLPNNGEAVTMTLKHSDYYVISVNPNSSILRQTGVKYVVLPTKYISFLEEAKKDGYKFLTDKPLNGYWIYQLN